LMVKSTRANTQYYATEKKENLMRMLKFKKLRTDEEIDAQVRLLEEYGEELSARHWATSRPRITFYEGLAGLEKVYEDTLTSKEGLRSWASYDPLSRVNPFVHVNHLPGSPRYGILMCLNGTGILNSWLKKNFFGKESYADMNAAAELAAPGADGIYCYPFGNGAERILENKNPGAEIRGIDFNRHSRNHVARAAQEGIVFSLIYGTEIMQPMGLQLSRVRAGFANMFLSNLFARSFANLSGCTVELYNTDGALGAARGAGFGVKYYPGYKDCFKGMEIVQRVDPQVKESERIREVYQQWKEGLIKLIK
ncbi:MAG: FGGY-family carbohydrate kinase, partial [Bacteroidota bacterium]|nr:FGGY-family carbohydrate kinase [Bacteroidota bacterium]